MLGLIYGLFQTVEEANTPTNGPKTAAVSNPFDKQCSSVEPFLTL